MADALDRFDRPSVAPSIKTAIADAFAGVDGRGALLFIADSHGEVHAHLAAKLDNHWKVAAGAGIKIGEKKPYGWVAVEASW